MRIVLTCGRVGPRGTQRAGDVIDLPSAEAQALLDARQAEPYKEFPEAMTVAPPENAMHPPAQGRRRSKPYIDSNHLKTR
jgi:hypothetical protein